MIASRLALVPEVAGVQVTASALTRMVPASPTATNRVPSKTSAFRVTVPVAVPALQVLPAGRGVTATAALVGPALEPLLEAATMKAYWVPLVRPVIACGDLARRTER